MNFIKYVKTQHNRDIKVLSMDNGNEYGGGKLLEFLKQKGIRQQATVPYTPEQEGVAERGNRTLFERVRSICIDTEAPKDLWPELFAGMVHIMNRTATTSLNGLAPLEALNQDLGSIGDKNKPSISHIRVLGCKAYIYIQKERRTESDKQGARAEEGILVGFDGTSIYRIWIPHRNGITRSSTVTFDETWTEQTQKSPKEHLNHQQKERRQRRRHGTKPSRQPQDCERRKSNTSRSNTSKTKHLHIISLNQKLRCSPRVLHCRYTDLIANRICL